MIKELRQDIDKLAQISDTIKERFFQVDADDIPEGLTLQEFMADEELSCDIESVDVQSYEVEDCVRALYMAKAWLGKLLEQTGIKTPYSKDGDREFLKDIEETADKSPIELVLAELDNTSVTDCEYENFSLSVWRKMSYISKVDYVREEISKLDEILMSLNYSKELTDSTFKELCYNNTRSYLNEARFHLGFDLERLKRTYTEDTEEDEDE